MEGGRGEGQRRGEVEMGEGEGEEGGRGDFIQWYFLVRQQEES